MPKKKRSKGSSKSLPSSTPIVSLIPSKAELEKIKIIRGYGVNDLKRYQGKIRQNIKVFEDAIKREKNELKRVDGMIKVLKNDIVQAEKLKKLVK